MSAGGSSAKGASGRLHPLVAGGLGALAARLGTLTLFFLAGGQVNGPLNFIPVAAAYHGAVLLGLLALLLLAAAAARSDGTRRFVVRGGLALFALTLVVGLLEFLLLRHTGHKLTPAVLRTYAGSGVFTKEVLAPLGHDGGFTAALVLVAAAGAGWLIVVARRGTAPVGGWAAAGWAAGAAGVLLWAAGLDRPLQRAYVRPPELAGWDAVRPGRRPVPPADEAAAVTELRALVPLAPGWRWTNADYPLARQAEPALAAARGPAGRRADPPDIVLIAVESLRAQALWFSGLADTAATPNLRRLAARGVVFRSFLANGYPSSEGFFCLHTGLWPRPGRTATVDAAGLRFTALPERLGALGYHRIALWGGNASFDHELSWGRLWYDELEYQARPGEWVYSQHLSDAELVRRAIVRGRAHDAAKSGQPLFLFLATNGTHGPFVTGGHYFGTEAQRAEAERINPDADDADRRTRYRRALELLDLQLGRLLDWLDTRPRSRRTVVVLTGDHSIDVDGQGSPLLRALPSDDFVWTGAVIAGPEPLVGPVPRTETFAASQVDLMPTLLALAGDTGPQAGPGADLFAAIPPEARTAVAVRPDGFRLDRGGRTLFVPAADAREAWREASFARPQFERPPAAEAAEPGEADRLVRVVNYWTYLLEQDRLQRPAR